MYSRDIRDSHKTVRKKKRKKTPKRKGKCLKQPWLSKNPQK